MSTAMTLTSKGQFTFNKGLLKHLGIKAGDQVSIRKIPGGKIEIEARENRISVPMLASILRAELATGKQFSIEEINQAIARKHAEAGSRGIG